LGKVGLGWTRLASDRLGQVLTGWDTCT